MKILDNDFTDLYLTEKNEIYITDKSYENSLKKIEISQRRFQGHSGIKLLTSKRIP